MRCVKCKQDFPERLIEESHDVPCYLFEGIKRNVRKNQADKYSRHWLCRGCHKKYEEGLRISLRIKAVQFSNKFFEDNQ